MVWRKAALKISIPRSRWLSPLCWDTGQIKVGIVIRFGISRYHPSSTHVYNVWLYIDIIWISNILHVCNINRYHQWNVRFTVLTCWWKKSCGADMVNIPLFAGFYTSLVGKLAGFLPSTYSPNTKVNCPIPPWQSNRAEPPQHHLYVGQHGWTSTQEISEMCSQKQGRTAGL